MFRAYKYRIYPNKKQKELLEKTFGCVRFYWNRALEIKLKALGNKEKIPQVLPALRVVGSERPELMPVEERVAPMKQEAPSSTRWSSSPGGKGYLNKKYVFRF